MNYPLISIIITVLNGAKTIEGSLNSISQQNFTDYEVVIIDGGSSDDTANIINASSVNKKTVRVIPRLGLYAGLNTGIRISVGQWLYFMGADDKLHSVDTLQEAAKFLNSSAKDTKVTVGDVQCVKQNCILRPMFGSPYLMRHQVHHQGMFYRREVFDNLLYNERMRISSDYELNLKLALAGIPHQAMKVIVCDFGGDGVSENQLDQGYREMQQVHKQLFKGIGRFWAVNYFWVRRRTGALTRRYNLTSLRAGLKKVFG